MSRLSLQGKHAVVTGAARGIGLSIAQALAAEGARVTVMGRHLNSLQRALLTLAGWPHAAAPVDVSEATSIDQAFAQAREQIGAIDILVNNAGQADSAPFGRTSIELWNRMLAVNLNGAFLCTRAALPDMLASGWGRIVNIASTAGLKGYAYVSAYTAAKHGVIGMTRSLALEVATKGITVNAVCPGYTETDLLKDSIANVIAKTGRSEADARASFAANNPQGRLVQPDEVADAVRWLCAPSAAAITGQAISVAGGETM